MPPALCQFESAKGGACICTECGRVVLGADCKKVYAACRPLEDRDHAHKGYSECPYLGGPTEDDTPLKRNRGCRGNRRTSVWECDLHGRCTPYGQSEDRTIKWCQRCSRVPPEKTDSQILENDPPPSQNWDDLTDAEKRASIQTEFVGIDEQRHKK